MLPEPIISATIPHVSVLKEYILSRIDFPEAGTHKEPVSPPVTDAKKVFTTLTGTVEEPVIERPIEPVIDFPISLVTLTGRVAEPVIPTEPEIDVPTSVTGNVPPETATVGAPEPDQRSHFPEVLSNHLA